jgi:aldehyde:ferredoxin oxidoreductase
MPAATLLALVREFKLVKTKKRCCKSKPRCKKCPVVCKRLANDGLAVRQGTRHYLVELGISKKTLKAARAR